ncbi:hypothetical protein AB0H43_20245 [Hamadaea sp. NPDC050747]|uniref:hypothetical protein n=1 Tax=Hamadaea sp. NPDC050747 TaxID=3155789 RepID=UPI0033F7075C
MVGPVHACAGIFARATAALAEAYAPGQLDPSPDGGRCRAVSLGPAVHAVMAMMATAAVATAARARGGGRRTAYMSPPGWKDVRLVK